jgi:hypothetical protein
MYVRLEFIRQNIVDWENLEYLLVQSDFQFESCDRHTLVTRQAMSESKYRGPNNEMSIINMGSPHNIFNFVLRILDDPSS